MSPKRKRADVVMVLLAEAIMIRVGSKPGSIISRCSKETREVIKTLTAEDFDHPRAARMCVTPGGELPSLSAWRKK